MLDWIQLPHLDWVPRYPQLDRVQHSQLEVSTVIQSWSEYTTSHSWIGSALVSPSLSPPPTPNLVVSDSQKHLLPRTSDIYRGLSIVNIYSPDPAASLLLLCTLFKITCKPTPPFRYSVKILGMSYRPPPFFLTLYVSMSCRLSPPFWIFLKYHGDSFEPSL
jgi:hypothetical protein